ncbi:MAG TPA: cupin domain-containing protein [Alphaproteobacteria bacterium]|jgi:gentisate 1,2-dioxygenase
MADGPRTSDSYEAALRRASVSALWARNVYPPRGETPRLWRWAELEPLLTQAVTEAADMNATERRVLTLVNQEVFGAGDFVTTTTNLSANFQVLMPGETAPLHRHSMNALRFVVEGEGAVTMVDDKSCPMAEHDMILTPAWCWHEHRNPGKQRVIWLDLLDAPLVKQLDVVQFERERVAPPPSLPGDGAFAAGGFVPAETPVGLRHSPLFRYAWGAARLALAATPPTADGARLLRYTNVAGGGAALNLLDCYLASLAAGRPTRAYRTTSNAVCFVAEGSGASRIGDARIAWARNDIFTLPHGHWISHEAAQDGAILFVGTDREILRRLDLLADENAA